MMTLGWPCLCFYGKIKCKKMLEHIILRKVLKSFALKLVYTVVIMST